MYPFSQPSMTPISDFRLPLYQVAVSSAELNMQVLYFGGISDEELSFRLSKSQQHLTQMRLPVLVSHKNLLQRIASNFLQDGTILEVGCGPAAFLYHCMVPEVQEKMRLLELNEDSIERLTTNPTLKGRLIEGSAYELESIARDLPNVVGLSSYDSLFETGIALTEAYKALIHGGRFIHIQDVGPASHVIKTIYRMDPQSADRPLVMHCGSSQGIDPFYIQIGDQLLLTSKYLHDRMASIGQEIGYRIVYNNSAGISGSVHRDPTRHKKEYDTFIWDYFFPLGLNLRQTPNEVTEVSKVMLLVMEKP